MNKSYYLILTALICFTTFKLSARQTISLNEVAKLEFSSNRYNGFGGVRSKFEIVPEGGSWKCYQRKDSLTKSFRKNIDRKELDQLLQIIDLQDTAIKMKQFHLKEQELISAADSLEDTYFKPHQRSVFFKSLRSNDRLEKSLKKILLSHSFMDDGTHYKIIITTKSNQVKTITAYSFANLYNLPWKIDNKRIYNPDISRIFASVSGDKQFESQQKKFLCDRLITEIYWSEFQTPFNWSNFKTDHPKAFARLSGSLKPWRYAKNKLVSSVYFTSALLPQNMRFGGHFRKPDTIMEQFTKMEERIVNSYRRNSFVFKCQPDIAKYIIYLHVPGTPDDHELNQYVYNKVKVKYQRLNTMTPDQLLFFDIISEDESWSNKWILLPDDNLILIQHRKLNTDDKPLEFINIDLNTLGATHLANAGNVCIVFSPDGKILENLGEIDLPL